MLEIMQKYTDDLNGQTYYVVYAGTRYIGDYTDKVTAIGIASEYEEGRVIERITYRSGKSVVEQVIHRTADKANINYFRAEWS
jgi:hypothetical protein